MIEHCVSNSEFVEIMRGKSDGIILAFQFHPEIKWLLSFTFKAFNVDNMSDWVEIALHLQPELLWCPRNPIMFGKPCNNMGTCSDQNNILLSSLKIKTE